MPIVWILNRLATTCDGIIQSPMQQIWLTFFSLISQLYLLRYKIRYLACTSMKFHACYLCLYYACCKFQSLELRQLNLRHNIFSCLCEDEHWQVNNWNWGAVRKHMGRLLVVNAKLYIYYYYYHHTWYRSVFVKALFLFCLNGTDTEWHAMNQIFCSSSHRSQFGWACLLRLHCVDFVGWPLINHRFWRKLCSSLFPDRQISKREHGHPVCFHGVGTVMSIMNIITGFIWRKTPLIGSAVKLQTFGLLWNKEGC